jgi:hypothetical protein
MTSKAIQRAQQTLVPLLDLRPHRKHSRWGQCGNSAPRLGRGAHLVGGVETPPVCSPYADKGPTSLHTPRFFIFLKRFRVSQHRLTQMHLAGSGGWGVVTTWSIAVFVALPFFKELKKKKKGCCLGTSSPLHTLCIHQTMNPYFLASSNLEPIAYYILFLSLWKRRVVYSVTLDRELTIVLHLSAA